MVLAATACTATFANTTVQHDNGDDNVLATTLQQVKQRIAGAPSGTTYGVVSAKNGNVVVNTPLGKYTIKRASDGTYSFMGMTARIVSVRNGVYTIADKMFVRVGKSLIVNRNYIYVINTVSQELLLSGNRLRVDFKLKASKEALKQLKTLMEKEDWQ